MTISTQFLGGGVPLSSPLLSVIVPVYKVEPYLRKALDSLLAQTYPNLEIICVDDGSPDGCPAILDEYAARDSRIVVIHQHNQGCAAARNAGLDRATGEFVTFLDSDDAVLPETYEKAMAHMTSDIGMVQFGVDVIPIDESQQSRAEKETQYLNELYGRLASEQTADGLSLNTSIAQNTTVFVWDKIFRRSLIERYHLRFPSGLWNDDACFERCYAAIADRMYFIPDLMYVYLLMGGGLSSLAGSKDARVMRAIGSIERIFSFCADHERWDRLTLQLPWLLYSLDYFKGNLPDDIHPEGEQRVRGIKQQWHDAVNKACPWDDRLHHLLGAMHGWSSVRQEWCNGWRCPKEDRRRIFPGLREFSRPGLRKFFVCGVPVLTIVDVGGRRFFKLFGVKIRKKRIKD